MTESRRSSLCPRCGGVIEPLDLAPGEAGEGACPDCGLGFTTSATFSSAPAGRVRGRRARREANRATASIAAGPRHAFERRTFPVYGLDGRWTGRRWAGGSGSSDDELVAIRLAHGDAYDEDAPLVLIETRCLRLGHDLLAAAMAAHGLAQHLWHEGGAEHAVVRPTFTDEDPTASWSELTIPVDGRPIVFRTLVSGHSWVALGRVGECVVAIQARHLDAAGLGLVTVEDVAPYLADDGLPC